MQVWKKVFISYIDLIENNEVDSINHSELIDIASLCSYDFGDAVHWARALVSEFDTTNFEVFDNCREEVGPQSMILSSKDISEYDIEVYPTPSDGNLTVILPNNWEKGALEIYDLKGQLIQQENNIVSQKIKLELKVDNGTYLLKLIPDNGKQFVKKIVIIK